MRDLILSVGIVTFMCVVGAVLLDIITWKQSIGAFVPLGVLFIVDLVRHW